MENRVNVDSQLAEAVAHCEVGWANSDAGGPATPLDVNATEPRLSIEPGDFPAPIGKLLGLKVLQSENGMAVIEFLGNLCTGRYATTAWH
jgi:hypothetical protein